jgi:hypothetical protein
MDNIDSFISELRTNTEDNIKTRKSREETERVCNDKRLNACIAKLTEDILVDAEKKMLDASKQGHYYATLYEFTNNDVYDPFNDGGYKTCFLMKGPNRARGYDGLTSFEHRGIDPLLKRLSKQFTPMGIFIKYDRHKSVYLLIVSWKNT